MMRSHSSRRGSSLHLLLPLQLHRQLRLLLHLHLPLHLKLQLHLRREVLRVEHECRALALDPLGKAILLR